MILSGISCLLFRTKQLSTFTQNPCNNFTSGFWGFKKQKGLRLILAGSKQVWEPTRPVWIAWIGWLLLQDCTDSHSLLLLLIKTLLSLTQTYSNIYLQGLVLLPNSHLGKLIVTFFVFAPCSSLSQSQPWTGSQWKAVRWSVWNTCYKKSGFGSVGPIPSWTNEDWLDMVYGDMFFWETCSFKFGLNPSFTICHVALYVHHIQCIESPPAGWSIEDWSQSPKWRLRCWLLGHI